ncbi:hypothetical protein [Maribacter flavus]|uniref:Uncharacterized protein n=1 Tax=Maribacter flavus TaxID=1658664 RepID=A0A5B2TWD1_9FLAO|nr:hypothetical protein [Maribacter flavus]KAA2218278.1 hypothetical protein F0361_01260 [Maribacter flavus]
MIAGFKTKWPKHMGALHGQPTNFIEKIWKSFPEEPVSPEFRDALHAGYFDMDTYLKCDPKGHTIRQDPGKRWKVGMDIHFDINVRTKNHLRFAPVKKVTAIQELVIEWTDVFGFRKPEPNIHIDGVWFFDYDQLARNDGFPSVDAFFAWFHTDFTGRIIHWTDIRY